MTQPQRLLHAMTDPTGRRGHDQPCAIDGTAASFRHGDGRSDARRPNARDQDRRDSIISRSRGLSPVTDARPGGTNSP
jgi:hypothetical protein